jgi:DNA polymerase III alpha subunit (gram-positive type)
MKLIKKIFAIPMLALALTTGMAIPTQAQCEVKNNAFKAGETINYNLYFNWKFVWVKCGTAYMKTTATTWQSKPALRTYLITKGSKKADMFFRMRDTLVSVVSTNLSPFYYYKGSFEGKRRYKDEAYYTYRNGQVKVRLRKQRNGVFSSAQKTSENCVYDMLSIMAQARSYDPSNYKVGQRIHFDMVGGTDIDHETLIYRGKKNIKAENDVVYRCLVFSYVEPKDGKEKEIVTFYVTDDENHLPIRLDMFLNFGSAKAFLTNMSGLRHPLGSVVSR